MQICLNTFDKAVELKPEYYSGKAMIKGGPAQIEQVILNICINALHAMTIMRAESERRGGTLNIVIKNVNADKHFCDAHPSAVPGRYWMISHHDTGTGMDSRTVEKIFDPFFTTKNNEQGTGLGLSMVYNILELGKNQATRLSSS
jgi:signal transduction histidine kinase